MPTITGNNLKRLLAPLKRLIDTKAPLVDGKVPADNIPVITPENGGTGQNNLSDAIDAGLKELKMIDSSDIDEEEEEIMVDIPIRACIVNRNTGAVREYRVGYDYLPYTIAAAISDGGLEAFYEYSGFMSGEQCIALDALWHEYKPGLGFREDKVGFDVDENGFAHVEYDTILAKVSEPGTIVEWIEMGGYRSDGRWQNNLSVHNAIYLGHFTDTDSNDCVIFAANGKSGCYKYKDPYDFRFFKNGSEITAEEAKHGFLDADPDEGLYGEIRKYIGYYGHSHSAAELTYGKLDPARLPDLSDTYAAADHTHDAPVEVKTSTGTSLRFWTGTQDEYDAIDSHDPSTLYIITEA